MNLSRIYAEILYYIAIDQSTGITSDFKNFFLGESTEIGYAYTAIEKLKT